MATSPRTWLCMQSHETYELYQDLGKKDTHQSKFAFVSMISFRHQAECTGSLTISFDRYYKSLRTDQEGLSMSQVIYNCPKGVDPTCPETCQSLEECAACGCITVDTEAGGPWGNAMDVILCLMPIAYLLFATLKRNPQPTTVSLPFAAFMLFLVRVMYLGSDPLLACASIIAGLHDALAPLTIMGGAIFLFETMESTLCMPYMLREMKALSQNHPIAECMLLFSFAYMVEGAAGFGTPAALGAPVLASLGYSKLDAVVLLLMFNTFATVWGAVGTPIWFGFGVLDLSEDDYIDISYKAGVCLFLAGLILIPTMALRVVVPYKVIGKNLVFIFLSFLSVTGPSLGLSFVSYEFPSLVGGIVGCLLTGVLITFRVGLSEYVKEEEEGEKLADVEKGADSDNTSSNSGSGPQEQPVEYSAGRQLVEASTDGDDGDLTHESESDDRKPPTLEEMLGRRKTWEDRGYLLDLVGRTFPLWGTVLLLVITRIEQIGLKEVLNRTEPGFEIHFGSYGTFRLSASLVLQLQDILSYPGISWKYALLYIPFILPFLFISVLTMAYHHRDMQLKPKAIVTKTLGRLRNPAIALFGALALVKLLINRGSASPASIVGTVLSDALKEGWVVFSCFVGMLGSFFSGSTTVSNLTFGGIQLIAAKNIGTSYTSMLALQATGGSAGNGVCLNNIIAACAVVGLKIGEGRVIARTGPMVLALCAINTIVMLAFFFRFD